jgi:hypothetical protein
MGARAECEAADGTGDRGPRRSGARPAGGAESRTPFVSDTKCRLPGEEQAEREKLKTIVRAILEAADKTGELDEKVLATLPPMLADQLRAAWAGGPVRIIRVVLTVCR